LANTFQINPTKNSISKTYLGFELWEVLTAFTVALTIASGLMWFSNLRPRQAQESYLWQNQHKNSLHVLWQRSEFETEKLSSYYSFSEVSGECGVNFNEISINQSRRDTYNDSLTDIKSKIRNIETKHDEKNIFIASDPKFIDLTESLRVYLNSRVTQNDKEYLLAKNLLATQKFLSQSCLGEYTFDLSQTAELDELLNQFNSEPEIPEHESFRSLKSEIEADSPNIEKVKSLTQDIFRIRYTDLTNLDTPIELREEFEEILESYELWEWEFVQGNEYLAQRSVYTSL
jgi:hypothetical protein